MESASALQIRFMQLSLFSTSQMFSLTITRFLFLYLNAVSIIFQAGLGSPDNAEQIMIALEPEAAAICCMEKNMSEFQSEIGSSSVEGLLCQPNSHYMVVDIGGNTSCHV